MSNIDKIRVGVEVTLDEMIVTPLISSLILLTELRMRHPKEFDLAVKALLETEL